MVAQLKQHGSDPLTPIVVQRGLRQDQIDYLEERAAQFPGVQTQDSYLRKYPYQSLARAGARLRRPDLRSRSTSTPKKAGYQPTDSIGQAGIESDLRHLPAGQERHGAADRRLARPPEGPGDARGRPPSPGESLRLTLDIGLQRAAEKALRYGVSLAHAGIEGAHADGGAIVALDPRNGAVLAMASYPTYQPSIYVGHRRPAEARAGARTETGRRELNYPGHQPRDRRGVSAGLDLQAGDGARRDAGGPGASVRPAPLLAGLQGLRADVQQLDDPDRPVRSISRPRSAMSCDTYFYELGKRFYNLPPDRGHPLQGWANRFGLGELDRASTSAPR